jgi:hypothetical protein
MVNTEMKSPCIYFRSKKGAREMEGAAELCSCLGDAVQADAGKIFGWFLEELRRKKKFSAGRKSARPPLVGKMLAPPSFLRWGFVDTL